MPSFAALRGFACPAECPGALGHRDLPDHRDISIHSSNELELMQEKR